MTEATFEKGQMLLEEIKTLKDVVYGLSATLRYEPKASQPPKKWTLRLPNRKKDSPGAPERAGVFLFDGISPYGRDIPVDEALVECLRDFFEKRLEDKQREFNELSD